MRVLQHVYKTFLAFWLVQGHEQAVLGSELNAHLLAGYDFGGLKVSAAGHCDSLKSILSPGARVYVRGEEGFANLTLRWQKYREPDFAIAVAVATEDDVAETVKYANSHEIPFLATTGGHGGTYALGNLHNGIQISMRNLSTITIDSEGNTVTVGGGTLTAELSTLLSSHGKETVNGVCDCTSVIGPLLGGGHGFLQGRHGLSVDQLISARIVTANGTVVVASDDENADLFWALRGAGHNFGIVTQMVLKLYDVAPGEDKWTSETFIFSGNRTREVFEAANGILEVQPADYIHAGFFVGVPAIDPEKPILQFQTLYNGPPEEAANITEPIRALRADLETVSEISYLETPATWYSSKSDPACQKGSETTSFLRFPIDLHSYNPEAVQQLYDEFAAGIKQEPRFNASLVLIEGYSTQGVQAVDSTSTAVAFRNKRLLLSPTIVFADNGDTDLQMAAISFGETLRNILHEGDGGGNMLAYVNYAHGDEGPEAWYGYEPWRLEKLRALKRVWDPLGHFDYYAPILMK